LCRGSLEISADQYANNHGLVFQGDGNSAAADEVKDFRKAVGIAGVRIPRSIVSALSAAGSRPLSLGDKLECVIRHLVESKRFSSKEGQAKIRELKEKAVVQVLHDAVHRLENVPSLDRVNHVLEVIRPVYNLMETSE
jgi:hypothetical protein